MTSYVRSLVCCVASAALCVVPAVGCAAENEADTKPKAEVTAESKAEATRVLSDWYAGLKGAKTLAVESSASFQVLQGGAEVQAQQETTAVAIRLPQAIALVAKDPAGLTIKNDDKQLLQSLGASKVYAVDKPFASVADLFGKSVVTSQMNLQQGLSLLGDALAASSVEKLLADLGKVEYIGKEEVAGVSMHHLRVARQEIPNDAWFTTDAKPQLVKVLPDLKTIAKKNGRELPDGVELKLTVAFTNWKYDSELSADTFAGKPPEGFELVDDLFESAAMRLVGKPAPHFEVKTLAGTPFKLAEQQGKVVVLDFWATWCGPCVAALPKISETTAKYKDKGVVFHAVNEQEEASIIKEFLAAQKLDVPVLLDADGKVGTLFAVEGIPQTVIIDKSGKIQVVHVGAGPEIGEQLKKELDDVLAGKDLASEKRKKKSAE